MNVVLARVVVANPLRILQQTATTPVSAKHLSSYTPTQNDIVAVIQVAGTVLVLGEVV